MAVDVIVMGEEIENEMDPSGKVWLHGVDIAHSSAVSQGAGVRWLEQVEGKCQHRCVIKQ